MIPQSKSESHDSWGNIFLLIVPYILIVGIFQVIAMYIVGIDIDTANTTTETPYQALVISFATLIGTSLTVWSLLTWADKHSFKAMGFQIIDVKKDIFKGLLLGFGLITIGFVSLILTNQIQIVQIQWNNGVLFIFLLHYIFVALSEEILFRGYILKNLMASCNKYIALLISSILFSLMHLANNHIDAISILELFIGGILLGLSYIYNKRLWLPVALHFSWNFFQGPIFGFNVSGHEHSYSLIQTHYENANIWNGGSFGFEGSVLAVVFELIAIIGLLFYFEKNKHSKY